MPTKYKWHDVRDFMIEIPDNLLVEAGRKMQIVTMKLCRERGLDEDPEQFFGPDVGLGLESTAEFEKLKSWHEQHKPLDQ